MFSFEEYEKIRVESYAGSRAEEHPFRFFTANRKIEITSIENSWVTPEARCFKVKADDGYIYELEYNESHDRWSLLTVNRQ